MRVQRTDWLTWCMQSNNALASTRSELVCGRLYNKVCLISSIIRFMCNSHFKKPRIIQFNFVSRRVIFLSFLTSFHESDCLLQAYSVVSWQRSLNKKILLRRKWVYLLMQNIRVSLNLVSTSCYCNVGSVLLIVLSFIFWYL